ncbi:MAG TPA: ArsI/CadI family heavy metal resistance metalloenzyme [Candidatus Eremiobacteraceae bacterium]|nr:ArsI/CadI family heavy metal resistance metalloenzyme [Candidatus Eremiobacteraceae bacterium]
MKTHLSLSTRDLDASVKFYRTLLAAEPAKHYEDYALFLTYEPALELALSRDPDTKVSSDAHYGIAVDAPDAVEFAIDRLRAAGLAVDVETGETCCYARQDKVWATDPDGRRWETYYVIEETAERNGGDMSCCGGDGDGD